MAIYYKILQNKTKQKNQQENDKWTTVKIYTWEKKEMHLLILLQWKVLYKRLLGENEKNGENVWHHMMSINVWTIYYGASLKKKFNFPWIFIIFFPQNSDFQSIHKYDLFVYFSVNCWFYSI